MPGDRPTTATSVYASQMGIPEADVKDTLAELSGPRMAEEALFAMGGSAWDETLSWRERSMVVVSALIAQGGVTDRLRTHVRWAVRNGVTREQIDALVSMLAVYVGYPRALEGMRVVIEELGPIDST